MKEKKLLDALGDVDERYIVQMYDTKKTKRKPTVKIILIAAALATMMAVLMGSAWNRIYMATSDLDNYPLKDPQQIPLTNIELTASNITATSMRIYCTIEGVEDGKDAILTQSQGPFTIEKKTSKGWEALVPRFTDTQWDGDQVLTDSTYDWPVDWSGIYGILEPGTYRYLTVVLDGKAPSYAEFTVPDNRNPELMDLLQRTLNSQSYCVRHTLTVETDSLEHLNATDRAAMESITQDSVTEYWRNNNQQLRLSYVGGQPWGGMMYKNGLTYYLDHEGDDRSKPVAGWSRWTELDRNRLTEWVSLILETGAYELRDALDGSGKELVQVTQREHEDYGVTSVWTSVWELDTSNTGEAGIKLAQQDVNTARPFSWKLDKQSYEPLAVTFANTQSQPITTAPEAIDRALAEYIGSFTKAIVYRDEAAGIWKVEFQKDYGYMGYWYVYLNDSGITQMIAEGPPKDYFR